MPTLKITVFEATGDTPEITVTFTNNDYLNKHIIETLQEEFEIEMMSANITETPDEVKIVIRCLDMFKVNKIKMGINAVVFKQESEEARNN